MTRARLEIVSPGVLASIQDLGRHGARRFGVPTSGALHPDWLRIANALAGAPQDAPGLEFFLTGPVLKAIEGEARVALAGDVTAELERGGVRRAIAAWRSVTLREGDVLAVAPPRPAKAGYLAVRGLAADRVLGSASTYLRGGFGGHGGRSLRRGDVIEAEGAAPGPELGLPAPPAAASGPFHAVPGPQDDHFDPRALTAFFLAEYVVANASDRMGMRLEGPALAHRSAESADIVSDAIVPGAIQVPGNGRPIVLLADGQTIGGYPKIATVASADLPRLALLPPGARVSFARSSVEEAEALARAHDAGLRALLATVRALPRDGAAGTAPGRPQRGGRPA